ncbi:MAG: DUF1330 domain-containing protein [Hyphomonadaceae bacterium]
MAVYALAQLRIHDRERYGRYMARFMDVFSKFNGRVLAADDEPVVVEGDWGGRNKAVLLQFPDAASFHAFADSPEYAEIAKDRKAGADALILLIQGF